MKKVIFGASAVLAIAAVAAINIYLNKSSIQLSSITRANLEAFSTPENGQSINPNIECKTAFTTTTAPNGASYRECHTGTEPDNIFQCPSATIFKIPKSSGKCWEYNPLPNP